MVKPTMLALVVLAGLTSADLIATPPKGFFEQAPTAIAAALTYPVKAQLENREGDVTLSCAVTAERRLADCNVAAETLPGYTFGFHALLLAPLFIVRESSELPADHRIEVKIQYRLPHG
jgi:hypothetical protein